MSEADQTGGQSATTTSTTQHVTHVTLLKFTFQMDSVVVNLFSARDCGLASFGIYHLSLKGQQLADQTLNASIVLCDMQLDDRRPHREHMLTKFMRKKRTEVACDDDRPESTMLDVVVRTTRDEIFVNLLVSSFDLIVSLEFLMQLMQFVAMPPAESTPSSPPSDVAVVGAAAATTSSSSGRDVNTPTPSRQQAVASRPKSTVDDPAATSAAKPAGQKMTVNIKIEQPDIILVEQMDNINCLALILNVSKS